MTWENKNTNFSYNTSKPTCQTLLPFGTETPPMGSFAGKYKENNNEGPKIFSRKRKTKLLYFVVLIVTVAFAAFAVLCEGTLYLLGQKCEYFENISTEIYGALTMIPKLEKQHKEETQALHLDVETRREKNDEKGVSDSPVLLEKKFEAELNTQPKTLRTEEEGVCQPDSRINQHELHFEQKRRQGYEKLKSKVQTTKKLKKSYVTESIRKHKILEKHQGLKTESDKSQLHTGGLDVSVDVRMKPDYALRSAGAKVVQSINTEPYGETAYIFGIRVTFPNFLFPKYDRRGPQSIIEPWLHPGECWMFRGSRGSVEIQLSHSIVITHVTLDHIPVAMSLDANIDSAPKLCVLIGLKTSPKGTILKYALRTFEYDKHGPHIQTFPVEYYPNIFFQRVEFHVLTNHGEERYTCVYKLRVHGIVEQVVLQ